MSWLQFSAEANNDRNIRVGERSLTSGGLCESFLTQNDCQKSGQCQWIPKLSYGRFPRKVNRIQYERCNQANAGCKDATFNCPDFTCLTYCRHQKGCVVDESTRTCVALREACNAITPPTPSPTLGSHILQTATYRGHIYHLLAPSLWEVAEEWSVQLGGHLVTINDAAENNFIVDTFKSEALNYAAENGESWKKISLFIGLNDLKQKYNWVWSSGERSNYTNWYPGEPTQRLHEDYGAIALTFFDFKWHDIWTCNGQMCPDEIAYGVAEIP